MTAQDPESMGTAFTVSVDARAPTPPLASPLLIERRRCKPSSTLKLGEAILSLPAISFPLQPKEGGVLRRMGHTQACVDLARMAGLYPAGVICEIMNDDGSMARLPELEVFADKQGLKIGDHQKPHSYRMQRREASSAKFRM